jgi:hypothetical protein
VVGKPELLPEHGVGAVILTNANEGGMLQGAFQRDLLELLFDGKPEAIENLNAAARTSRESAAKERALLTLPPNAAAAEALAAHYTNAELGGIDVKRTGPELSFGVGEWQSAVATRTNDDGTLSFVTATPGLIALPFVVGKAGDKRTLTLREAQSEYVFVEAE